MSSPSTFQLLILLRGTLLVNSITVTKLVKLFSPVYNGEAKLGILCRTL